MPKHWTGKDNYNTTNMPTTGGSVALAGFVPSANATQVDKLIEAGAIIIAKSNLHEYAYGVPSISANSGLPALSMPAGFTDAVTDRHHVAQSIENSLL